MAKRKHQVQVEPDFRSISELAEAMSQIDADHPEYLDIRIALSQKPYPEVLAKARQLCGSARPEDRAIGASMLPDDYHDESYDLMVECLKSETDARVLAAIAFRLGHLRDARAINLLLPLKQHPSEDVRFAAAFGLLTYDDPRAIQALIELSGDEDDDVRDWATFGLGSMIETDTPEIREALFARIEDAHYPTRLEAVFGLAHRKDTRVIEALLRDMAEGVNSTRCEALEEIIDLVDPQHPLLAAAVERCRRNNLWPEDQ